MKKCENRKFVVSSFGLWIDKMCAARILRCLSFRTWNHLRHSQRVKAVRNHYSHPLDLHLQQKQSIQLISRPIGKHSIHKKWDLIISGLDVIPDKIKQGLPSTFSQRRRWDRFQVLYSNFTIVTTECHSGKCASIGKVDSNISALDGIQDKIKLCLPTTFSRRRR